MRSKDIRRGMSVAVKTYRAAAKSADRLDPIEDVMQAVVLDGPFPTGERWTVVTDLEERDHNVFGVGRTGPAIKWAIKRDRHPVVEVVTSANIVGLWSDWEERRAELLEWHEARRQQEEKMEAERQAEFDANLGVDLRHWLPEKAHDRYVHRYGHGFKSVHTPEELGELLEYAYRKGLEDASHPEYRATADMIDKTAEEN